MTSESGFSPAIDAEFVGTGADYIHNDPDGKHMRLNAHGVLKWVAPNMNLDPSANLQVATGTRMERSVPCGWVEVTRFRSLMSALDDLRQLHRHRRHHP